MVDSEATNRPDVTGNGGPDGPAKAVSSVDRTPRAFAASPASEVPLVVQEADSIGSTSRGEEMPDDLSTKREVDDFIEELDDEEAQKLRRQRKAEALISASGSWIVKAIAEVGLPPDISNKLWQVVNGMRMTQEQKSACYFVCRHLLKAPAATRRTKTKHTKTPAAKGA